MKAAVLVGFGGIDQLELREVPEPETGPAQVKVRVVATSINPIDWKLREGMKRPGMSMELPSSVATPPARSSRWSGRHAIPSGSSRDRSRHGGRLLDRVRRGGVVASVASDPKGAEER